MVEASHLIALAVVPPVVGKSGPKLVLCSGRSFFSVLGGHQGLNQLGKKTKALFRFLPVNPVNTKKKYRIEYFNTYMEY